MVRAPSKRIKTTTIIMRIQTASSSSLLVLVVVLLRMILHGVVLVGANQRLWLWLTFVTLIYCPIPNRSFTEDARPSPKSEFIFFFFFSFFIWNLFLKSIYYGLWSRIRKIVWFYGQFMMCKTGEKKGKRARFCLFIPFFSNFFKWILFLKIGWKNWPLCWKVKICLLCSLKF